MPGPSAQADAGARTASVEADADDRARTMVFFRYKSNIQVGRGGSVKIKFHSLKIKGT